MIFDYKQVRMVHRDCIIQDLAPTGLLWTESRHAPVYQAGTSPHQHSPTPEATSRRVNATITNHITPQHTNKSIERQGGYKRSVCTSTN